MKLFKYLALLALASVPLLLMERRKKAVVPIATDEDDDIFERELRVD